MKRIIVTVSLVALLAAACGSKDVGSAGEVELPPTDQDTPTTTVLGDEPVVTTT